MPAPKPKHAAPSMPQVATIWISGASSICPQFATHNQRAGVGANDLGTDSRDQTKRAEKPRGTQAGNGVEALVGTLRQGGNRGRLVSLRADRGMDRA
jgi:hypothetical protein